MSHPEYFLYGSLGAASLELLKLYEYRAKLRVDRYRRMVRSGMFWTIVAGMLMASGFVAWAVNVDSESTHVWTVVVTGLAARSIVREAAAAKTANAPTVLGTEESDEISMRDIFN